MIYISNSQSDIIKLEHGEVIADFLSKQSQYVLFGQLIYRNCLRLEVTTSCLMYLSHHFTVT